MVFIAESRCSIVKSRSSSSAMETTGIFKGDGVWDDEVMGLSGTEVVTGVGGREAAALTGL